MDVLLRNGAIVALSADEVEQSRVLQEWPTDGQAELPFTDKELECWRSRKGLDCKFPDEVCTALMVADFLDADLSVWAGLVSSFLFGRAMPYNPHPHSTVIKLPKLPTPAQILAAVPRAAYPMVLSPAEHINIASKLALCPTDLHSSFDIHQTQEAIVNACLESHSDSGRHGITISTADLVKHGSVIARVPDVLSLHVTVSVQDFGDDEIDTELSGEPAHMLQELTSITSLSLTGHETSSNREGLVYACQAMLASCAHLGSLRSLKFTGCGWGTPMGCQGPDLLGPEILADALGALTQLKQVDLSDCHISLDSMPYVCSGLAKLSRLTWLNLSHNRLSCGGDAVYSSLQLPQFWRKVHLRHLGLACADLKSCDRHTLQGLVDHQSALTSLDLAGNSGLDGGLCALAAPRHLRSLNLAGTLSGRHQMTDFAQKALPQLLALTHLSLRGNGGHVPGMVALRNCFYRLGSLEELDLRCTGLQDIQLAVLVPKLTRLTSLRTLWLETGHLGTSGVEQLVELPVSVHGLQRLHLEAKAIPGEAAGAMGAALAGMSRLTRLTMGTMFTGDAAAQAWCAFAEQMPGQMLLEGFECQGCWLGAAGAAELMPRLAKVTGLRDLAISQVQARPKGSGSRARDMPQKWLMGPEGAVAVASAVAALPALVRLEAAGCGFGDAGVAAVARQLKAVPTLTHLDLGGNGVEASGVVALAEHIPVLRELRTLDVSEAHGLEQVAVSALSAAVAGMPAMRCIEVGQRESVWALARNHGPGMLRCLV